MGALAELPNIGPKVEEQLNAVGITTQEELRALGSRGAWLKIQSIDPSACLHRLTALEGAIQGMRKSALSDEDKAALKAFYMSHKA